VFAVVFSILNYSLPSFAAINPLPLNWLAGYSPATSTYIGRHIDAIQINLVAIAELGREVNHLYITFVK